MQIEFHVPPQKQILHYVSLNNKLPYRVLEHAEDADGVCWFPGAQLNIAEIALNKIRNKQKAIVWQEVH